MIQLKEVKKINRATIADGKLLNRFVVEPLSAIDDDLLEYLNDVNDKLSPIYSQIEADSGHLFNSSISGFSAISFNASAEIGAPKFAKSVKLSSTNNINFEKSTNTVKIGIPYSAYNSYYALAMAGKSYIDNANSVALMEASSATENSLAAGYKQTANKHSVAFGTLAAEAQDHSFSVNYGAGSISKLPYGNKFYIENSAIGLYYNYISGGYENIGLYYTSTIDSQNCIGLFFADTRNCQQTLTEYNSSSYDSTNTIAKYDSYISSSTNSYANANTRLSCVSSTLGRNNSIANTTSATLVYNDSSAISANSCIVVNDSYVLNSDKVVAINATTAKDSKDCFGINNCDMSNSGNFCINDCKTKSNDNILFNNCSALNDGADALLGKNLAINSCNVSNAYAGIAYNQSELSGTFNIATDCSTAIGSASFAIASSYANDLASIAFYNSNAQNGAIALLESSAQNKAIALHNSNAAYSGIALFNSSATQRSVAITDSLADVDSIAYDSSTATSSSIAMLNSSATNRSIALLNSSASNETLSLDNNRFCVKSDAYINNSFKCELLADNELNILVKG